MYLSAVVCTLLAWLAGLILDANIPFGEPRGFLCLRVLLPVLAGRRTPDWAWYAGPAALRPGWHGIPEPTTPPLGPDALGAVSLVVTSALAATASGERLGTGGGWYDRALTHRSPDAVVAALVNEREVLGHLPTEPWDVRVAALVTEAGVRWA